MFMFNKNNAVPGSSQSSIDSRVTDPSTSTSTSDAWVSHSSDVSSYGDLPSPERQERSFSGKRTSVFNLRSRSNTATSLSPSFTSFSSSMTSDTKRSSQDLKHFAGHSFMELSGTRRSIFTRGKKSKRASGQFDGIVEDEEADIVAKRTSLLRKGRKGGNQSEFSIRSLKHRISSPFDFQHVAHTDRDQFETAIEEASENDLVAEFWTVRASQAPRSDLAGIKADNLHFQNFSSENLAASEVRSQSAASYRSPPLSPQPSQDSPQLGSPLRETSAMALRSSRSAESFSQPGLQNRFHRHTQSGNAPPRMSSRLPLAPIDDLPEEPVEQSTPSPTSASPSIRNSGIWDLYAPFNSPIGVGTLSTITDEPDSDYVGHAVSTPDNTAILPTPPFTPGVKEIQDGFDWFAKPRPAPQPPVKSPKAPFFESFSFRNNQRSPIARSNIRSSPFTSPKTVTQRNPMTRPISQMSETLGAPILARRSSIRRTSTVRRKSNTWRGIEDSWEDDIDYIYDNALEADCDLDWERVFEDGAFEDRDPTPEQSDFEQGLSDMPHNVQTSATTLQNEPDRQSNYYSGPFRPSLLVPSSSMVPELESAVSASTADTGVRTPSEIFSVMGHQSTRFSGPENFTIPTPLLSSPDMKEMPQEQMYDDLLADYEGSDRHFPLLDATQSITSSTRSSHVRSSKRSSYDSSLMSSGITSGSWSSPVRRSASSSGSLPDLVHSRRARRDFNMVVDQLSDQVASFTTLNQEDTEQNQDHDATPPGRSLQSQTFFSSDEEDNQTSKDQNTVEGEVRASLELARQGSQRATRAPLLYHKYASSDGAAKLLASSMQATPELQQPLQTRHRAASSPHTLRNTRQAYFSLFPVPPTHSPVASPTSTQH
ncbi:hypothetical protein P154DRAFT_43799 [Amniculicola lignicola CBS 123094]|uniref:CRIB domain-containing protein n=1 Tax=Amniculicola lignicola CBS 123094 TaxID=1392246 RepID=A0A6A5WRY0_9PLEO|nr:hypothetical protein P154DRAFT_43799 [Amniculicola lignicola CBS 123094]